MKGTARWAPETLPGQSTAPPDTRRLGQAFPLLAGQLWIFPTRLDTFDPTAAELTI
jgi:hypothetical protein